MAGHAFGLYWWKIGLIQGFLLPLACLPAGLFLLLRIWTTAPGPTYNNLLALSGMQLLLFAALLCMALS